ncbi:MAG: potassium transporter TrkG [Thermoanaerobaculum sp.]
MKGKRLSPAQGMALSFAAVILAGSVLLCQNWAAVPGKKLRFVEALFTATSATCVTGLSVRPPGDFTVAGQIVILTLIQVGGLGVMTFGLFFALLLGGRLSLFGRQMVLSSLAAEPWEDFWPLLKTVMGATLVVETAGALLLAVAWWPEKGPAAIGWGFFHAVSAFCNAGFGLHPDSLIPFRTNALVNFTIGMLIIVGGVGFLPVADLWDRWRSRKRRPLSLHSRLVLATTGALLLCGWVGFAVLEWGNVLAGLSWNEKLWAVWLAGITPRTAGFANVDYGHLTPATLLFTMVLMFIGASPGSTGGGIKTTTFAVLFALVVARVRSHRKVTAMGRRFSADTLGAAVTLTVLAAAAVITGFVAVSLVEHGSGGGLGPQSSFLREAFDVVSAFGTVGLSTGITPSLKPESWLVEVALMYIGRIGPLTLSVALLGRAPKPEPELAEESVMVG